MRTEELAPAKINLGLAVLGRRVDGYHEIHSLMATLDVGDRLSFETTAARIELEVAGADLPSGSANLAYRAAAAYLEAAGQPGGVRIVLEKELPIAAGLGGGSSDAAAVLRALERLYPAGLDLQALARPLGADVPFLVRGGTAVATGVGERLEPIELPALHLVLANPGVAVSAAGAYRNLAGRFGPPLDIEGILSALGSLPSPHGRGAGGEGRPGGAGEHSPGVSGFPTPQPGAAPCALRCPAPGGGSRAPGGRDVIPYRNDLELPVVGSYPEVSEALDAVRDAGLHGVLMSGSGSTVFGLARSRGQAEAAAASVAAGRPGWWVRAASTL